MNEKTNRVESLKNAYGHYASIDQYLQSVANKMEESLGKENFQSEIFLKQFDFSLQMILFKVITADGEADESEIYAIKNIPHHGDVLDYLSENLNYPFFWGNLEQRDIQSLVNFDAQLDGSIEAIFDNFMEYVAFVDVNGETSEAVFLRVAQAIDEIATDVAGVNGLIEGSERLRIYESLVSILRKKYDECVQRVCQRSKPGEA